MQDGKNNNKFIIYVFVVMIIAFVGLKIISFSTKRGSVIINKQKFKVEIVKHNWELERGLSGRRYLAKDGGMLFVFPYEDKFGFWMKDMNFSIDIIWINDGRVVYIKPSAPIPVTHKFETFYPDNPAKYVLEINAGMAEKYGFEVGDEVILEL